MGGKLAPSIIGAASFAWPAFHDSRVFSSGLTGFGTASCACQDTAAHGMFQSELDCRTRRIRGERWFGFGTLFFTCGTIAGLSFYPGSDRRGHRWTWLQLLAHGNGS